MTNPESEPNDSYTSYDIMPVGAESDTSVDEIREELLKREQARAWEAKRYLGCLSRRAVTVSLPISHLNVSSAHSLRRPSPRLCELRLLLGGFLCRRLLLLLLPAASAASLCAAASMMRPLSRRQAALALALAVFFWPSFRCDCLQLLSVSINRL